MRFCLLMAAPATWTAGGPGAGVGSRRQVSSAEAEGCGSPCPGHSALRPGRPPLPSSPLPPARYLPLVTASSFGYYDFSHLQLRHKIVLAFFSLFLLTEQVFYLFLRFF